MTKINITKYKILMEKWKNPVYIGDANKLNQLAEETINQVNSEPLLKDICEIFMYAVSVKMMRDPNLQQLQFPNGREQFQKVAK